MLLARRNEDFIPTLFNELLDWNLNNAISVNNAPQMNVIETRDDYKLEFSVPGLKKEDLSISVDADDNLVVQMVHQTKNENKEEKHYLRREFSTVQFRRALTLPTDVNREEIKAKVENGVLEIELPKLKVEERKPQSRMIEIK